MCDAQSFTRAVDQKTFVSKLEDLEKKDYGALELAYIVKLVRHALDPERVSKEDKQSSCQSLELIFLGRGINIVKIDDITREGRLFREAREYVLAFLMKDLDVSQAALKVLLSYNRDPNDLKNFYKQNGIKPFSPKKNNDSEDLEPSLQKKIKRSRFPIDTRGAIQKQSFDSLGKKSLLKELDEKILPREIFTFPFVTTRNGTTLDTGHIGISVENLNHPDQVSMILIAFLMLHGLCNLKKNMFQRAPYGWNTLKFIKKHQGGFESGEMIELELLGKKPSLSSLSKNEKALKILADIEGLDNQKWIEMEGTLKGRDIERKYQDSQTDRHGGHQSLLDRDCLCGRREPRVNLSKVLEEIELNMM